MIRAFLCFVFVGVALLAGCGSKDPKKAPKGKSLSPQAQTLKCTLGQEAVCLNECNQGNNGSCEQLESMYLTGVGVPKSPEKVAALDKRLCEEGRRYFCPNYAMLLSEGVGLQKDRARAKELFTSDCQYNPTACSEFGSLYTTGKGVPKDEELGRFLLTLACQHNDKLACRELGVFAPPR